MGGACHDRDAGRVNMAALRVKPATGSAPANDRQKRALAISYFKAKAVISSDVTGAAASPPPVAATTTYCLPSLPR